MEDPLGCSSSLLLLGQNPESQPSPLQYRNLRIRGICLWIQPEELRRAVEWISNNIEWQQSRRHRRRGHRWDQIAPRLPVLCKGGMPRCTGALLVMGWKCYEYWYRRHVYVNLRSVGACMRTLMFHERNRPLKVAFDCVKPKDSIKWTIFKKHVSVWAQNRWLNAATRESTPGKFPLFSGGE